jgi:hypothetical protein
MRIHEAIATGIRGVAEGLSSSMSSVLMIE